MCRAMVIEDDNDMRYLVRTVLDLDEETEIVCEARNAEEALPAWRATEPDVIVLDYRLPGQNGLDIAEEMLTERPEQSIVLFSAFLDKRAVERAERLGVKQVLSKDQLRDLPRAVTRYCRP